MCTQERTYYDIDNVNTQLVTLPSNCVNSPMLIQPAGHCCLVVDAVTKVVKVCLAVVVGLAVVGAGAGAFNVQINCLKMPHYAWSEVI